MEKFFVKPKPEADPVEKVLLSPSDVEHKLREGIKTEAIKDVVWQMYELVKKIAPHADQYDSIISDDASGRLVSLFLKKVLDPLRSKGSLPLKLRFIVGDKNDPGRSLRIEGFLMKNKENLGKILLSTEFIYSGNTIEDFIRALEFSGIPFDLAALTVSADTLSRGYGNLNIDLMGSRVSVNNGSEHILYSGEISSEGLSFYGKEKFAGVKKNRNNPSLFPLRYKGLKGEGLSAEEKETKEKEVQQHVNQARRDIDLLAKRVVEFLEK